MDPQFLKIPRSRIVGSCGSSTLNFLRSLPTVCHSGCIILHSHQYCRRATHFFLSQAKEAYENIIGDQKRKSKLKPKMRHDFTLTKTTVIKNKPPTRRHQVLEKMRGSQYPRVPGEDANCYIYFGSSSAAP